MTLALASGIPPAAWASEGERTIATAFALLDKRDQGDDQGRQLSG